MGTHPHCYDWQGHRAAMAPPAQSGRNERARRRQIAPLQNVVQLRRCYASRTAQRAAQRAVPTLTPV